MPGNLTGQNLSDVYTSFLHTETPSLCSSEVFVYDGIGNKSTLSLSTTSVSISNLKVNQIEYPQTIGIAGGVVVSDGVSKFTVSSIASAITSINTTVPVNGTYSSPVLTVQNGFISNIVNSTGNKTFFYPSRVKTSSSTPSKEMLLSVVTWNSPVVGDKAIVMQKVNNGDGSLYNIDISVFTYEVTGWSNPQTY